MICGNRAAPRTKIDLNALSLSTRSVMDRGAANQSVAENATDAQTYISHRT